MRTKRETEATKIADLLLEIETLETRRSDELDFHELAIWQIRRALFAAYDAGRVDGFQAATSAPEFTAADRKEIEIEDDGTSITAFAPRWHCLDGLGFGVHSTCVAYNSPPGAWRKPDAYEALADDLKGGVGECFCDDCNAERQEGARS